MDKNLKTESLQNVKDSSNYGMIHAIYGKGRGKTTSALGLAIRAAGYGLNVSFVQFMKDGKSNERKIIENIPNIDYYCPGYHGWANAECGLKNTQKMHALSCLEYIMNIPKTTNMLVCDEILNVSFFSLDKNSPLNYPDIETFIKNKRSDLELVLTGLHCPENVLNLVDYASEIYEVRHPFQKGLIARQGIEY